MTDTDSNTWLLPLELEDGHRLFETDPARLLENGKPLVAIADDSGGWPHETDDGIWWLDFDESLMLPSPPHHPTIPIIDPDGNKRRTASTPPTVLSLAARFEWDVNAHGRMFVVRWP